MELYALFCIDIYIYCTLHGSTGPFAKILSSTKKDACNVPPSSFFLLGPLRSSGDVL